MTESHVREAERPGSMGRRRTLSLALLAAFAVTGTLPVRELKAAPLQASKDTLRTPPLYFQSGLLSTNYLARAAEKVLSPGHEVPVVHATISDSIGSLRAESYAQRFGIARELAQKIVDAALSEGIDPELGFRLVHTESRFKTRAHGPSGAVGLTQLMPGTARTIDRSVDSREELMDPATNLHVGFRYLRQMIERYGGDVRLGLLAYNRGEIAVDRALRRGKNPENGYSSKVLGTRTTHPYRGKGLVSKQPAPKAKRPSH
ncbi:MAG TPA: lytic transglycosylase domain-containing protein [Longimicrobiaceae bacterium]|nr:lytic transglycosylase domain-containing protein [Longimicrobiaceae bacterium]